jgi:hypothetical protein
MTAIVVRVGVARLLPRVPAPLAALVFGVGADQLLRALVPGMPAVGSTSGDASLWTPAVEEQVGALVFRDANGASILSYGAAVAVDADGDRFVMTTSCVDNTITLRLPAAELESAVLDQLRTLLWSLDLIQEMLPRAIQLDPILDEAKITVAMTRLDAVWDQLFPAEQSRSSSLSIWQRRSCSGMTQSLQVQRLKGHICLILFSGVLV